MQAFAANAISDVRSLEKRCGELVQRAEREMFGLGDLRRNRSAMALVRLCKEVLSECEDFISHSREEVTLAILEKSLGKLCQTLLSSYNRSGRVAAISFRSEVGTIAGQIGSLQRLYTKISQFQVRNTGIMGSTEQIGRQAGEIGQHLEEMENVRVSIAQLEREIWETRNKLAAVEDKILEVEKNPGIKALDQVEAELRAMRGRMLQEEMSRLRGVVARFLSEQEREGTNSPQDSTNVLSSYLKAPLTSLAREQDGYPLLKHALSVLLQAVETRGIGLNERKARKVRERVSRIVNGSLVSLQLESRRVFRSRADLVQSRDVMELKRQRRGLREERARLLEYRRNLETKKERVLDDITRLRYQIASRLDRIEKLSRDWFGTKLPEALRNQITLESQR